MLGANCESSEMLQPEQELHSTMSDDDSDSEEARTGQLLILPRSLKDLHEIEELRYGVLDANDA